MKLARISSQASRAHTRSHKYAVRLGEPSLRSVRVTSVAPKLSHVGALRIGAGGRAVRRAPPRAAKLASERLAGSRACSSTAP